MSKLLIKQQYYVWDTCTFLCSSVQSNSREMEPLIGNVYSSWRADSWVDSYFSDIGEVVLSFWEGDVVIFPDGEFYEFNFDRFVLVLICHRKEIIYLINKYCIHWFIWPSILAFLIDIHVFELLTGDLTDAKYLDLKGSKQFVDEWQTYHEVVKHCQHVVKTWLDLRGNHGDY